MEVMGHLFPKATSSFILQRFIQLIKVSLRAFSFPFKTPDREIPFYLFSKHYFSFMNQRQCHEQEEQIIAPASPCRSNTYSWMEILGMREKWEWEAKGSSLLVVGSGGTVKQGQPPPHQCEDSIKALFS